MATRIHNCFSSCLMEGMIFTSCHPIPDQDCPICYQKLTEKSPHNNCCTPHSKKLVCGHFVHVACQIDYNPNFKRCPVCRQELIKCQKEKKD